MGILQQMGQDLAEFGSGPTLAEMPRRTLADKGIDGPTAAHRIEEIHAPYNFAYLTCTTGSSAFQNTVGVTLQELPARVAAGKLALELAGLHSGDTLLITYPPLVSVFSKQALDEFGLHVKFILRPSRDALLAALGTDHPRAVLGESSFLRAAIVDAKRLGVADELPKDLILLAAGSPLDVELKEEAASLGCAQVHDLYGCQEFGWMCLDGMPLRKDLILWDMGRADGRKLLLVGGLSTGDCFLTRQSASGEVVLTPTRRRVDEEPETLVLASTAADIETVFRTARTILRLKAKIVRVDKNCICKSAETRLLLRIPGEEKSIEISGSDTGLFDALMEAQKAYQREARTDPVWNKLC